jgi:hypothetical protein
MSARRSRTALRFRVFAAFSLVLAEPMETA